MSVQRVYVGEPGGENLDVLRQNTNEDTKGQASFKPGDVVSVPKGLAERLDASWATEGDAKKRGIGAQQTDDQGGDE